MTFSEVSTRMCAELPDVTHVRWVDANNDEVIVIGVNPSNMSHVWKFSSPGSSARLEVQLTPSLFNLAAVAPRAYVDGAHEAHKPLSPHMPCPSGDSHAFYLSGARCVQA
jgi:hypothetical protein